MAANEYNIIAFAIPSAWEEWLDKNYASTLGVWVRFFKKGSTTPSITYAEALDVALCYGWIDSQTKKFDETSYLQKFTPRRAKSIWSKINTEHIERLIHSGKMKPAGLMQVEEAKKDRRWDKAYDSPGNIVVPDDFLEALAKDKKAEAFFVTLNRANIYAIAWRLQTAVKPETRARRMKLILEMLSKGEKFH